MMYDLFSIKKIGDPAENPTIMKLNAAGVVFVGLILSLIPIITGMDKDSLMPKRNGYNNQQ